MPDLKTRKPTGAASAPLILVEGAEKSGKSWACAAFSASPRVGTTYWIDLGEGSADEYGAVPGANYQIVVHNGTFGEIYAAITEIHKLATIARDAGEKPVCLVIDSMSAEWELLKDLASNAMRRRLEKRRADGKNVTIPAPDEEVKVDTDLWTDAAARHYKLMRLLMTFPGIVLATARGKETIAFDDRGNIDPKVKAYKIEGQKNLGYDASLVVRYSREHEPMITGGRSTRVDLRPGKYKPTEQRGLTLEHLVFDLLGFDPSTGQTRDLVMPDGDVDAPESPLAVEFTDRIATATTPGELETVWERVKTAVDVAALTPAEGEQLKTRLGAAHRALTASPASDPGRRRMFQLFGQVGMADDVFREDRLKYVAEVLFLDVPPASTNDLTDAQVQAVVARLEAWAAQENPPAAAA